MSPEYEIAYIESGFGGGIGHASGPLTLIERDGRVVEVVVETDGGATFIPASTVVTWERKS